jgi:hypothetical protein
MDAEITRPKARPTEPLSRIGRGRQMTALMSPGADLPSPEELESARRVIRRCDVVRRPVGRR